MRALGSQLHLANVPSSAAVGDGNTGLANELSPDAWLGHSSPYEIGNVNASVPSQHEPHEDDRLQPGRSAMVMDNATARMDLQSDVEAPSRPSSDIAATLIAVVPFATTAAIVFAVDHTEPRMHNRGNEGDGTSEGSKKKEPVFLGRVSLVDLDDCDILDKRLLCDNKDTNDEEALNREDMDVDVGAPSCV